MGSNAASQINQQSPASTSSWRDRVKRSAKTGDKEALAELPTLERAHEFLKEGKGLWEAKLTSDQLGLLKPLSLLTAKPIL